MHDIICPHCDTAFKIDEAGYADILKQVHDSEFDAALHERLELAEKEKQNELALASERAAAEVQKATAEKEAQIQKHLKPSKKNVTLWPTRLNKLKKRLKPLNNLRRQS